MRQSSLPGPELAHVDSEEVDLDGLLCALVLAPSTYSRNRNFNMYQGSDVRAVLRRSRIVRGLIRELVRPEEKTFSVEPSAKGMLLTLEIPVLGFRRRALLSPLEHDLVDYLLARSRGERAVQSQARVERALSALARPRPKGERGLGGPNEEECSGASGS